MKTIFELFLNSLSGSGLTHGLTLDTITYATVQSILARLDLIGETLNDIDDTISAPGTGILARLDALENPSEGIHKKQSRCYQVNKSS